MTPTLTRRALVGGGLTVLFVTPSAPAGLLAASRAEASGAGPVRLGVLADLTGPLTQHARPQLLGIRHRAEAINAAAGHGHDAVIELLVHDIAGDPAKALDAVASLLEQGVHALVGPSTSWLTDEVTGLAQASCTPLLAPALGSGADLAYVFPAGPTMAQVTTAVLRALKLAGLDRVALLGLDELASPDDLSKLAEHGLTPAGSVTFPLTSSEVVEQAGSLLADTPDVLVVNAPAPLDAIAVRDARAAGWTGPIVVPPTSVNPGFHPAAGPAAEGVRTVAPWLAAPQEAPTTQPHIPTMRRFAESFEAANGPAGTQAGYGADAVSLAHLAFLGHRDRKMARGRLDQMCCVGVTGVYNMTPADHAGLAGDALTPMTSQSGVWTAG